MMRRSACAALFAAGLALLPHHAAGFSLPWCKAPEVEAPFPRPVVSIVVDENAAVRPSIPGIIAARVQVLLGFQALGRIIARPVDIGDTVTKGQILASLDPDDLQGNVRAARAALAAAEVELQTAQAAAERTRALAGRNVASTAQLEQAERALTSAQAALLQARSELVRAEDAENFADMRAPFDGVISAVFANSGAVVSAGEPVVQLSSQHGIEAVIDISDQGLAWVAAGDRYEIWSEREPERIFEAGVSQIEPVADAATRTRRVHLALPEDAPFRLGALVRARPSVADSDYLAVPQSAIFLRDGAEYVWVVTRTEGSDSIAGTVSARPISTTGPPVDGIRLVVGGLSRGEEVVIRGARSLAEGQDVGWSMRP